MQGLRLLAEVRDLGVWLKLADTETRIDYIATATSTHGETATVIWTSTSIAVSFNCPEANCRWYGPRCSAKIWLITSVLCLLNTPVMRLIRWNVCCWSDIHTFVQMCLFYVELVANPTKLWNTDAKLQEHCLNNQFYQKICLDPRFCDQPLVLQIHVLIQCKCPLG